MKRWHFHLSLFSCPCTSQILYPFHFSCLHSSYLIPGSKISTIAQAILLRETIAYLSSFSRFWENNTEQLNNLGRVRNMNRHPLLFCLLSFGHRSHSANVFVNKTLQLHPKIDIIVPKPISQSVSSLLISHSADYRERRVSHVPDKNWFVRTSRAETTI